MFSFTFLYLHPLCSCKLSKERIYENKDTSSKEFKICSIDNRKSFYKIDLYVAEEFINMLTWVYSSIFLFSFKGDFLGFCASGIFTGKKAEATWIWHSSCHLWKHKLTKTIIGSRSWRRPGEGECFWRQGKGEIMGRRKRFVDSMSTEIWILSLALSQESNGPVSWMVDLKRARA